MPRKYEVVQHGSDRNWYGIDEGTLEYCKQEATRMREEGYEVVVCYLASNEVVWPPEEARPNVWQPKKQ